jgi:hypothetical protein
VTIALLAGMTFLVVAETFIPSGSTPGSLYHVRGARNGLGRTERYSQIGRILVRRGLLPTCGADAGPSSAPRMAAPAWPTPSGWQSKKAASPSSSSVRCSPPVATCCPTSSSPALLLVPVAAPPSLGSGLAGTDPRRVAGQRDPRHRAARLRNRWAAWAEQKIPAGTAALLLASVPVCKPRSAHVRMSVGLAGGHAGCWRTCPCEGVGAARCVGQPVPAGHAPDQVRRVGCGHPGRGDEQRASRGSAHRRHRVGSGAEPGLGHPGHRDAELGVRMRPGRADRWGPGRRSRRPPAGPARSDPPGLRAAAGARAGRTRPAGRALPGGLPRCVRPARARTWHRRPARLPPGRRRCSGSARPRRRTRCSPGGRRFPCLEDARTCAGHQGRVLATASTGPQRAVQQVTKRNWSASSARTKPPIS